MMMNGYMHIGCTCVYFLHGSCRICMLVNILKTFQICCHCYSNIHVHVHSCSRCSLLFFFLIFFIIISVQSIYFSRHFMALTCFTCTYFSSTTTNCGQQDIMHLTGYFLRRENKQIPMHFYIETYICTYIDIDIDTFTFICMYSFV